MEGKLLGPDSAAVPFKGLKCALDHHGDVVLQAAKRPFEIWNNVTIAANKGFSDLL